MPGCRLGAQRRVPTEAVPTYVVASSLSLITGFQNHYPYKMHAETQRRRHVHRVVLSRDER